MPGPRKQNWPRQVVSSITVLPSIETSFVTRSQRVTKTIAMTTPPRTTRMPIIIGLTEKRALDAESTGLAGAFAGVTVVGGATLGEVFGAGGTLLIPGLGAFAGVSVLGIASAFFFVAASTAMISTVAPSDDSMRRRLSATSLESHRVASRRACQGGHHKKRRGRSRARCARRPPDHQPWGWKISPSSQRRRRLARWRRSS